MLASLARTIELPHLKPKKRSSQQPRRPTNSSMSTEEAKYERWQLWVQMTIALVMIITAWVSCRATKATEDAAKATQESVVQSKATTQLDQRAWVSNETISGRPELDKPFRIAIKIKNTGKTFAKKVKVVTVCKTSGGPPDFSAIERRENFDGILSVALLAPNGDAESTVNPSKGAKIPQADLDKIEAKPHRLFVFGQIDYQDIFGRSHWNKFCYVYAGEGVWHIYDQHNDADDIQGPLLSFP